MKTMKKIKPLQKSKDLCVRCGRCCILKDGITDCPFLVRHSDGFTSCSVYEWRLGLKVCDEPLQICVSITNPTRNHYPKGCPYS